MVAIVAALWKIVPHVTWLHVGPLTLVAPSYLGESGVDRVEAALKLRENRERVVEVVNGKEGGEVR